jgi:hypothetical protein
MARSRGRKPPRPQIPDHVPDFQSMPPAPDPGPPVYSNGEIIAFIATALGVDDLDSIEDVSLICRTHDPYKTFLWNSKATAAGTGQPKRLMLLFNVLGGAMNMLADLIAESGEDRL